MLKPRRFRNHALSGSASRDLILPSKVAPGIPSGALPSLFREVEPTGSTGHHRLERVREHEKDLGRYFLTVWLIDRRSTVGKEVTSRLLMAMSAKAMDWPTPPARSAPSQAGAPHERQLKQGPQAWRTVSATLSTRRAVSGFFPSAAVMVPAGHITL